MFAALQKDIIFLIPFFGPFFESMTGRRDRRYQRQCRSTILFQRPRYIHHDKESNLSDNPLVEQL